MLTLALVVLAAPLMTSQAFGLLETSTVYKVEPGCQRSVDLILRGTSRELMIDAVAKDTHLSVHCVKPHDAKVAAAVDKNAAQCSAGVDSEQCQAWLVHARSLVLDAIADDKSTAADFAHVMSAMTAIGFHEPVDKDRAARAFAGLARLSESHDKDMYVQRFALSAWMVIPGGGVEIADILKRALNIDATDPDLLAAIVVLSEHTGDSDVAATLADNVVQSAKAPTSRAYALYLSGCIALQKHDTVAAHDYFASALKNDPFDSRYSKAVKETAPESKVQAKCALTFSPFSQALKTAIATKT